MKKLLFLLGMFLGFEQHCFDSNALNAQLMPIYTRVYGKDIQNLTDTQLVTIVDSLSRIVGQAVKDAMAKSKNIIGKQDISLMNLATRIKNITDDIIQLHWDIKRNASELKRGGELLFNYFTRNGSIRARVEKIKLELNVAHITSSKRQAQAILKTLVAYLAIPIDYIKTSLNRLNPYL